MDTTTQADDPNWENLHLRARAALLEEALRCVANGDPIPANLERRAQMIDRAEREHFARCRQRLADLSARAIEEGNAGAVAECGELLSMLDEAEARR
jgi:hypothetical protein